MKIATNALAKARGKVKAISISLGNSLRRLISWKNRSLCEELSRGIYKCSDDHSSKLIALYTIEEANIRLEELEYLDFLSHLKRYLNTIIPPGCHLMTLSKIEPINTDKFLSNIDGKLQMRLVELEQDKANTRLRASIEKLLEVRKRILSGMIPFEISSIIAIVCRDLNIYRESLVKIPGLAKQMLNISLSHVKNPGIATQLSNFCQV
ncbi:MAG: hypothetical protein LM572_00335 [Ignisphaera sp.]|jgi:hypothetical protein|nr:hypothetical protein [Ignisphaera sp.]MCC6055138.1 hypothetical protein [Desulfurococcaceae archaeon]